MNQRFNLGEDGKTYGQTGQGFNPDPGNPAVRDYRGASANVAMVEM